MSDDPRQLLDEKAMRALLSPSPADPEHAVHASMARLEREFIRSGADPSAPSAGADLQAGWRCPFGGLSLSYQR